MLLQAVKVFCLTLLYLGASLKATLCEELIVFSILILIIDIR